MATRAHIDTTAKVRTRLPLHRRWSAVLDLGDGRTGELTIIWTTQAHWIRRHDRDGFTSLPLAGFLIAFRIRL